MSLRLEGFDSAIRGHRSLIIGKDTDCLRRMNILESESLYKGRSILVIQEPARGFGSVGNSVFRKRWDCVFRIRESFEAQMLATYVANAPKPVRIMWLGSANVEIPRALWQKWNGDITLLGCSTGSMLGCDWESIFFPLHHSPQETEKILSMRTAGRNLAMNVSGHLSEIAASGAALVWSNIDDKQGTLYWYDPTEGELEKVSKADAISMLEEVLHFINI